MSFRLRVTHVIGDSVRVSAQGQEIALYSYAPRLDAFECPSPYFHPLRSLAGDVVTHNRPHDHRWHKGLAMTASHVDDQNFWGGGSYRRDVGYVDLDNVGVLRHRAFEAFEVEDESVRFVENIDWITARGEHWIDERRTIRIGDVDHGNASWALEFATELTNRRSTPMEFSSPTVHGRPNAGYTGLFWRGPREFAGDDYSGAKILADGGREGPGIMGERAGWLAVIGRHDDSDRSSTLVFEQDRENADYPAPWFVRREPYAVVNPSLAFFESVMLAPGETMRRRYRIIVASGRWDEQMIQSSLSGNPL